MRGQLFTRWLAVLGVTLTALGPSWGFGGEDPLNGNPWHHEDISFTAARQVGYSEAAAHTVAWHADYVDSYLYNPIWWAPGGVSRFRAALSSQNELKNVHFDDLFSSDQVRYMWRRYTSGTVAGLIWAAENNDVEAAQNILGVSLHAIQDFYSHSNWVDAPDRRNRTFFQTPVADRANLNLYTGAYELEAQLGIKHHGAYCPAASVLMQPGVSTLLDIASSGYSPLQNMPIMETYRKIKGGVTDVQAYIPFLKDNNIRLPENILFIAPPGIALDSTWMAEIGTRVRGITDATPLQMFNTAKGLAIQQTAQWLRRVEWAMGKAGHAAFWDKVKANGYDKEKRTKQYEEFNKFPYTFLSTGPYPPEPTTGEEFYLRVNLKTSGSVFAGTNSDIYLKVEDKKFLLDYMPRAMPVLAHDDFEMGSEAVYCVGPFTGVPPKITFYNDAANAGEILKAAAQVFVQAGKKIGDLAMSLIAGNADWIGTEKKIWMPEDLARVTQVGENWSVDVNGGDQGYYRVSGTIRRTAENEAEDWAEYQVALNTLFCVKESKWDRGSNSDEPFVMALASSLPGQIQPFRTEPYKDVDKNETNTIGQTFTVRLPRKYGVLNLPICVMEHDDESAKTRDKLLNAFAGQAEVEGEEGKRSFLTALDSARAADWKLEAMKVYAWNRNGVIRTGKVFDRKVDTWVDGGKEVSFNLFTPGLVQHPITTDQLLREEGTNASEPEPTTPSNPNNPETPAPTPTEAQLNDFMRLKGTWKTNKGTILTVIDAPTLPNYSGPKLLYGKAITNPGAAIPDYKESAYFRLAPNLISVEGDFTAYPGSKSYDLNSYGMVYVTLSADGNKFTGKVVLKGGNEYVYTGERVTGEPSNPSNPGNPGTPNAPAVGAIGSWGSLLNFAARVDKVQPGVAPGTLDVFVTYKNTTTREAGITAGGIYFYVFDTEGIGMPGKGNLYTAEGDRPEYIDYTLRLQPGAETAVRYIMDLPTGVAPLYRVLLEETGAPIRLVDLTKLPQPAGYVAPVPVANVTAAPNPKFLSLTDVDIRLDGIRKASDGIIEGFFSIRNPQKKRVGISNYRLSLASENGAAAQTDGNLYRWSGERAERIQHSVQILPGGIAKVRYRFQNRPSVPAFTKLTVQEGNGPIQSVPLPTLP